MSDHCTIPRWDLLKQQLDNLSPDALPQWLESHPHAVIIDCRTANEFAGDRLPGALHIDYLAPGFWEAIEELDTSGTYLVYCRTGRRSLRTCTLMKNGGFSNIYNLDGGLVALRQREAIGG